MLNMLVCINKIGWSEMPTGFFSPSTAGWDFFVYTKNSDVKIHISTKLLCSSSCGSLVQLLPRGPGAQCWGWPSAPCEHRAAAGWAAAGHAPECEYGYPVGLLTCTVGANCRGEGWPCSRATGWGQEQTMPWLALAPAALASFGTSPSVTVSL